MNEIFYNGDPLEGTRWEKLSFDDYYNMANEERQELRCYLECINAPYWYNLVNESNPEGHYNTWRDIVSMTNNELEEYKQYVETRAKATLMPRFECNNYDDCPF